LKNENDKRDFTAFIIQTPFFFIKNGDPDILGIKILEENRIIRIVYRSEIEYTEPVTDSLKSG
jgi:hypothetical protein